MASHLRPSFLVLIVCVLLTLASGFRMTKSARSEASLSSIVEDTSVQSPKELFDEVDTTDNQTLAPVDTTIFATRVKTVKASDDDKTDMDKLIVIGEKLWQIVKDGEAVKNIETKMISVMPDVPWANMGGWRFVQGEAVKVVSVKEVMTKYQMIELTIIPTMFYGGSYQGSGQYLKDVKLIPSKAYCAWAHYLNVDVISSEPHNIGTTDSPIAEIWLTADIKYGTIPAIQKWSKRAKFIFSGNGQIRMVWA